VNADDFGLTYGVNRAIVEAHEHGIVTSSTLMANGSALEHAVDLTSSTPQLSGCHVVLVDGSPSAIRHSSEPDGREQLPRFRTSISDFALHCLRGKLVASEVEAEATAQIRKLQAAEIAVSHLDTHKHTHLPQVLPLLRAANNCRLRAIRNPAEPIRLARVATAPELWAMGTSARPQSVGQRLQSAVNDAGMITPDGCSESSSPGDGCRLLKAIINHIPDGTWNWSAIPDTTMKTE
jgi:predicted glycoside hydrolase/deacetylase ChbG (UPF0249 family)